MKFTISLLTITLCASLCASDEQPQRGLAATLARLRANRGQTAPEVQRVQQSAPSVRDLVKAAQADNPEDFEKTLRSFLDNNPGCKTWDESCENACPRSDIEIDWGTDISSLPDFDRPIACKDYLGSCYRNLRGCSPEEINKKTQKLVSKIYWSKHYAINRCKAIGLICQGAHTDMTDESLGTTLLHLAALQNDYHFTQFLLEHGASINSMNAFQRTPLHLNMYNPGNPEIARLLIAKGDDVHATDWWGHTPLMDLAQSCYKYTGIPNLIAKAKVLFSAGAKTHHRATHGDCSGKTAREIARANATKYDCEPCQALANYIEKHERKQSRIQE